MKKAKGVVLGLCFCGALFALGGCSEANTPYNILVSDTKTQFEIGEEFSFSENMKVDLVFEDEEKMSLETPENYTFLHDPIKKTYSGLHYTIDYEAFDSTKGGSYPIFVDFKDKDPEIRDIRVFYLVTVERNENSWVQMPVLENWTYGQTPAFTQLTEAEFNNESLEYSFRNKGVGEFIGLEKENICQRLSELNAGEYELNVAFKKSYVYETLETTLDITVGRATLPQNYEEHLENLTPQVYTGEPVFPRITMGADMFRIDNTASWQWVDAGVYEVPIEVNPNYKWKDTDNFVKKFRFEILPGENSWIDTSFEIDTVGQAYGWVKGEFSLSKIKNAPIPAYGSKEMVFAYKLADEADSAYVERPLKDLGLLDPGKYVLKAYLKDSGNYTQLTPIVVEFEVFAE